MGDAQTLSDHELACAETAPVARAADRDRAAALDLDAILAAARAAKEEVGSGTWYVPSDERDWLSLLGDIVATTPAWRDDGRVLAQCNTNFPHAATTAHIAAACPDVVIELVERVRAAEAEVTLLHALINTPRTDDWFDAVRLEAAHQIDRWGVEHDAGKRPEDWIALLVYLLGKATMAHYEGDGEKLLHHIISTSAALLNWHRAATGVDTRMRPGVPPKETP